MCCTQNFFNKGNKFDSKISQISSNYEDSSKQSLVILNFVDTLVGMSKNNKRSQEMLEGKREPLLTDYRFENYLVTLESKVENLQNFKINLPYDQTVII